jgi:multiple sugar transport system permease protein
MSVFDTVRNFDIGGFRERLPLPAWFIVPAQIVLLFIVLAPALISIFLSFTDYRPTFYSSWIEASIIGFENYVRLLGDDRFLYGLGITAVMVGIVVAVELVVGFVLAWQCKDDFPGKKAFVLLLITPLMVMPVVSGNVFYMLFRSAGPVNQVLTAVFGSGAAVNWLSEFPAALVPILLSEIWHWYPLMFLIMLAGLTSLPENQLRAAEMLDASLLQRFRYIIVPHLKGVVLIGVVIRSMLAIKIFDTVQILTRGGPGTTTETISMVINRNTFEFYRLGYASTMAWVVFLLALVVFTLALRPILYEIKEQPTALESTEEAE